MSDQPKKPKVSLKFYLMNVAHLIDVYRFIPRLLVAGYSWMVYQSVMWFQTLPDPTSQHTFLISTIVGGAAAVFGLYVNSGAKWDDMKSADPTLYIKSGAGGSEYQHGQPPNEHSHQRPPRHTHDHPRDRYEPQMEVPTRQRKRGYEEPEMDEAPPEEFYEQTNN